MALRTSVVLASLLFVPQQGLFCQGSRAPAGARVLVKPVPAGATPASVTATNRLAEALMDALMAMYPCADILSQGDVVEQLSDLRDRQVLGQDAPVEPVGQQLAGRRLLTVTAAPVGGQVMVSATMLDPRTGMAQARSSAQVSGSGESMAEFAAQFAASLKGLPGFGGQTCGSDKEWTGTIKYENQWSKEGKEPNPCGPTSDVETFTERYTVRVPRNGEPALNWAYSHVHRITQSCSESVTCREPDKRALGVYSVKYNLNHLQGTVGAGKGEASISITVDEDRMQIEVFPAQAEGLLEQYVHDKTYSGSPCAEGYPPPQKMDNHNDKGTRMLIGAASPVIKLGPKQSSVRGNVKTPEGGTLSWSLVRTGAK